MLPIAKELAEPGLGANTLGDQRDDFSEERVLEAASEPQAAWLSAEKAEAPSKLWLDRWDSNLKAAFGRQDDHT